MSRFTPAVEAEFEFEGDRVVVTLRRLSNKQMVALAPHLAPDPAAPAALRSGVIRSAALIANSREVILECVTGFAGLKDSTGAALTLDAVLDEAYFLPLLDQVFSELLKVSVLTEADAKKLDALLPGAPAGGSANPMPSLES